MMMMMMMIMIVLFSDPLDIKTFCVGEDEVPAYDATRVMKRKDREEKSGHGGDDERDGVRMHHRQRK